MSETTNIHSFFTKDHERLDLLFQHYQTHKQTPQGEHSFHEFKKGLLKHIEWEEKILFPVFEEKSGLHDGGPTHVMRMEHKDIIQLLESIEQRLRDKTDSVREEQKLLSILSNHNHKEENILYPAIHRFLSQKETMDILKKISRE